MVKNPLNHRYKRTLKKDFAKNFVIFFLIVLMVSAVSGFEVTNNSVVKTIENNQILLNQESGYFEAKKKINHSQVQLIEAEDLKLYEEFYKEEKIANGTDFRFYKIRTIVDLQEVFDGRLPETEEEIAIERLYGENNNLKIGDELVYGDIRYTIVGTISLVDYSCLFQDNNQMMMDSIDFGVGVLTSDGFNRISSEDTKYRYAYKYNDSNLSTTELNDKNDDLKDILVSNTQLDEFLENYNNKAITFVLEDAESDSASMYIFLYLMIILIAYISAITISNTIHKEATVIGTLKASGYTNHELLMHYMLMPTFISILGVIVGNIIGYTYIQDFMKKVYYTNYSLAKYVSYFKWDTFLLVSVLPLIMMFSINYLVLRKTLKLSPLKFLRKDLSKHKHKKAIKLSHKIPFFSRFRTRIIIQNKNAYITLIIGIWMANLLFFFGLGLPDVLNNYMDIASQGIIAPYETILNMPVSLSKSDHKLEASINLLNFVNNVQTENEDAEKFSFYSLKMLKGDIYKEDDVNVFGMKKNSNYFKYELKSNDCYVSQALATKYELDVGSYFIAYESSNQNTYTFKVTGITDNNASLEFYLNMNTLNDIFELGDDTFVGYLSNTPIEDIDSQYISQVITAESTASVSKQLLNSMGEMMNLYSYFSIIVFVLVLYLLSKMIIERNTVSISMSKILGYSNLEISRLYVVSTTIVVIFAALLSIPIVYGPLVKIFEQVFYIEMAGWLPLVVSKSIGVKMFVINIVLYALVSLLEFKRISAIKNDEALKNVE